MERIGVFVGARNRQQRKQAGKAGQWQERRTEASDNGRCGVDWQEFAKQTSAFTVAAAGIGWVIQKVIITYLNRGLKEYGLKLKHEHDMALERLRNDLRIEADVLTETRIALGKEKRRLFRSLFHRAKELDQAMQAYLRIGNDQEATTKRFTVGARAVAAAHARFEATAKAREEILPSAIREMCRGIVSLMVAFMEMLTLPQEPRENHGAFRRLYYANREQMDELVSSLQEGLRHHLGVEDDLDSTSANDNETPQPPDE